MKFNNLAPEHAAFLTQILDIARLQFEASGEMQPCIFIKQPGGQALCVPAIGVEKSAVSHLIDQVKESCAAVLATEAWFSRIAAKPGSAIAEAVRNDPENAVILEPRADPARREAVMIQFHYQKRHILCMAEITRADAKPPALGDWQITDNAETELHRRNFSPEGARMASGIV